MSEPINDGGPAFPVLNCAYNSVTKKWEPIGTVGMSLRDWFAGQETLAEWDHPENLISDLIAIPLAGPKPQGNWSNNPVEFLKWEAKWRAAMKYIRADAMIAAREKGKE